MVMEALERVGLTDRAHHKPSEMSGGQQQRVAIARAISVKPAIIMADEPTGALDSRTGEHVMQILAALNGEGTTVILITHNPELAAACNRLIRISDGVIVEDSLRGEGVAT
jgi:putative ABC transport system ATP-binding protein